MTKEEIRELYNTVMSEEGLDFCSGLDPDSCEYDGIDDNLYEILEDLHSSADTFLDACQEFDMYVHKNKIFSD